MNRSPYDLRSARRSLVHFGLGKIATALSGFAWLMLVVRAMETSGYGALVTLLALVEISYLVSGFGLSYVVQRYIPEFRMRLYARAFRATVWRLVVLRAAYAVLPAVLVVVAGEKLLAFMGVEASEQTILFLAMLLIAGCTLRLFDEIFPALLLQGCVQFSLLVRNLVKLLGVAVFLILQRPLGLEAALVIELASAGLALMLSGLMTQRYLKSQDGGAEGNFRTVMPKHALRDSLKYYVAQLIGQSYSPSAVKLVVSAALGPTAVATYGFVQSLADMMRNYQPAVLLVGWIRPIVVSRYSASRDGNAAIGVLLSVFKVGFLSLLPLAVAFFFAGDGLGAWLSGGKFNDIGMLLGLMALVVTAQGMHVLLNIAAVTFERPGVLLRATLVCAVASVLLWRLVPEFGVSGAAAWLFTVELLWIAVVGYQLRLEGHWSISMGCRPWLSIGLIGAFSGCVGMALADQLAGPRPWSALAYCAAALVTAWGMGLMLRVFSVRELAQFSKLLPASLARRICPTQQSKVRP